MDLSTTLTPHEGDHPCWEISGTKRDIPILWLDGGPLDRHGMNTKPNAWSIRPYGEHGEAIRYFRELAIAATEVADRLEQMDGDAAKEVLDAMMIERLGPRDDSRG